MGFIVSTPSYLYQTPSGYIFRLRIPKDLKELVGKVEFRYSLRSGSLRIAKYRARCIASFVQQLFTKVRNNMAEFTQEKIQGIVKKYIRQTLDNDERCRALDVKELEGSTLLEGSSMGGDEVQSLMWSVDRWMKNKDHSLMDIVTKRCLVEEGVEVDPESAPYKLLSRELLKAFQSILKVRAKRSEGDYETPDQELIPMLKEDQTSSVEAVNEVVEDVPVVLFSDVQKRYVAENEKGDAWSAKTKVEYLKSYALFIEVMGDMDVSKIDRRAMNRFKDTLMELPPNRNKNPKYRDLSIPEILELKPAQTIAPRTINKNLVRIGSLFGYAVKCGDMLSNPATDLQVKIKSRPDEDKQEMSSDDLTKLFDLDVLSTFKEKYPARFWTPLIALYAGCRLEEACQLHLEDLRKEDGVWVFDLNAKGDKKKLKNMASSRLVPIHKKLIEFGLLEYVDSVSGERLFPELHNRQHGNYGHSVSRWFSTYCQKCGVEKGKSFHSLRHTFITHLKHKMIDETMLKEVVGHAVQGETYGRYGKRYPADLLLREVIEKIDYEI